MNACGAAFTLRVNLPFFRLHPSFGPFLAIPIETKEMTNGNRRTNHPHWRQRIHRLDGFADLRRGYNAHAEPLQERGQAPRLQKNVVVPLSKNTFTSRTFVNSSSAVWNNLPVEIKSIESLLLFKSAIKTFHTCFNSVTCLEYKNFLVCIILIFYTLFLLINFNLRWNFQVNQITRTVKMIHIW